MPNAARLVAASVIVLVTGLASFALAQPRRAGGRARPKPAAPPSASSPTALDAGSDAKSANANAITNDEEHANAAVGGAANGASESGDGGAQLSPLTPAPAEMPATAPIDAGSVDYDRLVSDVAALRARVLAVGDSFFPSRMNVSVRVEGDRSALAKLTVRVDDGVVFTSPPGFRGDDWTPVFARALAPGRHALTIDVEREDRENVAFKSSERSRFVVEVPQGEALDVGVRVEDDSSMGEFPAKKKGDYDVRVRLNATTSPLRR